MDNAGLENELPSGYDLWFASHREALVKILRSRLQKGNSDLKLFNVVKIAHDALATLFLSEFAA